MTATVAPTTITVELPEAFDQGIWYRVDDAADLLATIGPPAAAALRALLSRGGVAGRVHVEAAIWDIAGADEALPVLDSPLAAWRDSDAMARSDHCLPRAHGRRRQAGSSSATDVACPAPARRRLL